MFKKKAVSLFVASAIIIPLIFLMPEIISLGAMALLFILAQAAMIYLFNNEPELSFHSWYALFSAIISLVFMLILVLLGRSLFTEMLGLLLFLFYFISVIIFLFGDRISPALRKFKEKGEKKRAQRKEKGMIEGLDEDANYKQRLMSDEDLDDFRKKDELQDMAEFFEPGSEDTVRVVDLPEPTIEKIVYDRLDDEDAAWGKKWKSDGFIEMPVPKFKADHKKAKAAASRAARKAEQEWKEINDELPKSIIYDANDYNSESEKAIEDRQVEMEEFDEAEVKELREAPKVDLEKVKRDMERIDAGIKTISDRIKEISEKAIEEGEEKKRIVNAIKKMPKPKKKELRVFASKSGTRFHYKRNCLSLKRVKNKDLVTFSNSELARKKGLKRCNMCK